MKVALWVAGLFVAATVLPAIAFTEASPQKRTPPPTTAPAPAPPSRKPPAGSTSGKAVPRPPAARPPARPAPRPKAKPPETRTLIFPYYFRDFDFIDQFPYGVYPYPGYPYPPYGYPVPLPGCATTAEGESEETGAVRLDIPQKEAAVYVDGFFIGAVRDFNETSEELRLPPGPHHFELRATGFQTLTFDVIIQSGKTITYRTPMLPVS